MKKSVMGSFRRAMAQLLHSTVNTSSQPRSRRDDLLRTLIRSRHVRRACKTAALTKSNENYIGSWPQAPAVTHIKVFLSLRVCGARPNVIVTKNQRNRHRQAATDLSVVFQNGLRHHGLVTWTLPDKDIVQGRVVGEWSRKSEVRI